MLTILRRTFKNDALFWLNILILAMLVFGMVQVFGVRYVPELGIYGAVLGITYFLLKKLSKNTSYEIRTNSLNSSLLIRSLDLVILFVLIFQIIHYSTMGTVPVVKAMMSIDYYHIAQIRQDIKKTDHPILTYGASFILKAIIPVTLMLLWYCRRNRFWVFLPIGLFYAFAMMQKALILTILCPLIVSLLIEKRWIIAGLFSGLFLAGVVVLVMVTNPTLRPYPFDCGACENSGGNKEQSENPSTAIAGGIYHRVFITTGEMVGNWFYIIPSKLPYLKGDGYQIVAKMRGRQFKEYSYEVYKFVRPKEAKMGFDGTATTAHFMYDYANFGIWGLALAGIVLAIWLVVINTIFGTDFRSLVALNTMFIFWLSSAQLSTMLFSGGWFLTILLYWFYKPLFQSGQTSNVAE